MIFVSKGKAKRETNKIFWYNNANPTHYLVTMGKACGRNILYSLSICVSVYVTCSLTRKLSTKMQYFIPNCTTVILIKFCHTVGKWQTHKTISRQGVWMFWLFALQSNEGSAYRATGDFTISKGETMKKADGRSFEGKNERQRKEAVAAATTIINTEMIQNHSYSQSCRVRVCVDCLKPLTSADYRTNIRTLSNTSASRQCKQFQPPNRHHCHHHHDHHHQHHRHCHRHRHWPLYAVCQTIVPTVVHRWSLWMPVVHNAFRCAIVTFIYFWGA